MCRLPVEDLIREGRFVDLGHGRVFGVCNPAYRTLGRETRLANFVKQSAITDFQDFGGLAAVPMICLQNFEDHIVFHAACYMLGDALQGDTTVFI